MGKNPKIIDNNKISFTSRFDLKIHKGKTHIKL